MKINLLKVVFNKTWLNFKDFTRRTASDKTLRDKAFNNEKNLKYDGYQRGIPLMVYKLFDKKTYAARGIKNEDISKKELAQELHKPIFKKFKRREVYSSFIDNI